MNNNDDKDDIDKRNKRDKQKIEEALDKLEKKASDSRKDFEEASDILESIKFFGSREIRETIVQLGDTENQAAINGIIFDLVQKYYKKRLDMEIVIPKTGEKVNRSMVSKLLFNLSKTVFNIFNMKYKEDLLKDFNEIEYIEAFTTTDMLDECITQVPIEHQLIKKEGCNQAVNLNNQVISEIKDLTLEKKLSITNTFKKQQTKDYFERQVLIQNEIIQKYREYIKKKIGYYGSI
jgi:hypothetical protein